MFKRSFYLVGALAGALVWSAAAYASPGETTGTALMRSGPGTTYPVIARLPAGAPVDIIACSRWCELGYGGRDGYVRPGAVAAAYIPAPYAYSEPLGAFDEDAGPWDSGFAFRFHDRHDHGHGHDHGGMGHGLGGGPGHGGTGHDHGGHDHDRH